MCRYPLIVALLGFATLAAHAAEQAAPAEQTPPKRLDLRVPDITTLYTPEQIARILAQANEENLEGVQVEGERGRSVPATPEVWGAIAAPFWALLHPTQAWRIFLPIPPDRARGADRPPDAMSTIREPVVPANP